MNTALQFWSWFVENKNAYTFLNSVDENIKEELLDEFLLQLHQYCDKLYFEIGGFPDEENELIITAEGDKAFFTEVEELTNAAPHINGWTIMAFKPPVYGHFKSKWEDLELSTEDMWFFPLESGNARHIGIRIYIKNYDLIKNNEYLTPLLYKMLDTILGEKSFALDITYIDTELLPDDPEDEGMDQIIQLPEYVKWKKLQIKKNDR